MAIPADEGSHNNNQHHTHPLSPHRLTPKVPPTYSDFTPAQKQIYTSLITTINLPPHEVDALYDAIPDTFNGRVIGTDAARELCPEYQGGWEGALLYSAATSAPASCYAQDRFRREIEKNNPADFPGKRKVLVMTAGGPASGKTAAIRSSILDGSIDLVMDQNLGKHQRAIDQIELALKHGWDVRIVYVYKPFHLIAHKVIERAGNIGRWSPVNVVGGAHRSAQDSVIKLYDKYMLNNTTVDEECDKPMVTVELKINLHSKETPGLVSDLAIEDIRPGGKYHLGDKARWMDEQVFKAMKQAKEASASEDGTTKTLDPRLLAAMEFGTNPAKAKEVGAIGSPNVYVMSRYHTSTHSTDRKLEPEGVLKLSSGDCRDLIEEDASDDNDDSKSKKRAELLNKIEVAPCCKVTWGTAISRRLEHINDLNEKYPHLKEMNKLYCATPYEEAHATAISCKAHDDVRSAMIMVAFGGSCLHVLSINQDVENNNLVPGSNLVSKGLSIELKEMLVKESELIGSPDVWMDGHKPPMPPPGTFYTTFPLDADLDKTQFTLVARLFVELNTLLVKANGSYLVCGAPTNINPNNGQWWPDKLPRAVQTTFYELAQYGALPQVKNEQSGLNHGGLLSDRHKVEVGCTSTTVHEMVLSVMAAPRLGIDSTRSLSLPGIGLALDYF